ncbi:MAG: FeoB-associated Cys-rich membrane protein [Ruminiclostridium sp.]|nr:FeoB-associated Cys-rich membrane protein [Ruminiclostridium sp.]
MIKIYTISLIMKGSEIMFWTIVILSFIGLAAALLIFFNIKKSFKKSGGGSCCGCDKNCNLK